MAGKLSPERLPDDHKNKQKGWHHTQGIIAHALTVCRVLELKWRWCVVVVSYIRLAFALPSIRAESPLTIWQIQTLLMEQDVCRRWLKGKPSTPVE